MLALLRRSDRMCDWVRHGAVEVMLQRARLWCRWLARVLCSAQSVCNHTAQHLQGHLPPHKQQLWMGNFALCAGTQDAEAADADVGDEDNQDEDGAVAEADPGDEDDQDEDEAMADGEPDDEDVPEDNAAEA